MNDREMLDAVRVLMAKNRVEWQGYRYTRPAPSVYEHQWLWDSCFHAIINCHVDPEMAKDELRSLLYKRGENTHGMVPHMIYWDGGGTELWGQEYTSTITQPPMIAWAALRVYQATGDQSFLREVFDPICRFHDWLLEARDPDGDHLLSIIHPWESGWDASPRWDDLMKPKDLSDAELKQARFKLASGLRNTDHHLQRIMEINGFNVEPVCFNAIFSANSMALAKMAGKLGFENHKKHYQKIAKMVAAAMQEKMWDETAGSYWDLAGASEEWIKVPTPASLLTLFSEIPLKSQAERLVYPLRTSFSAPYMIPTVAVDHFSFSPGRYWRGSTWLNINWFVVIGLKQYGFDQLSNDISTQSFALVEKEGFCEYYDPLTGNGYGSNPHSWSGLILDMKAQNDG
jgi:glycogen debranching enzyme